MALHRLLLKLRDLGLLLWYSMRYMWLLKQHALLESCHHICRHSDNSEVVPELLLLDIGSVLSGGQVDGGQSGPMLVHEQELQQVALEERGGVTWTLGGGRRHSVLLKTGGISWRTTDRMGDE